MWQPCSFHLPGCTAPRHCVRVALRETPDKDRAGFAADALAGEIHLVTQHAK